MFTGNVGQRSNRDGTATAHSKYYLARQLNIVADQPFRQKLSHGMTSKMIDFAGQGPPQLRSAIMSEGMPALQLHAKTMPPMLQNLGIKISPNMLSLPARRLPAPKVTYSVGSTQFTTDKGYFNVSNPSSVAFRSARSGFSVSRSSPARVQFFKADNVEGPKVELRIDECLRFVQKSSLQELQFQHQDQACIKLEASDFDTEALKKKLSELSSKPDLVVLLLPKKDEQNGRRYSNFKIVADQLLGIKSMCLNWEKLGSIPKLDDYFFGLSMKLNLRCGGYNHVLANISLGAGVNNTLILGADVTHPSPGDVKHMPSIAAVVGSVDDDFGSFPGSMRLNPKGQESIDKDKMKDMVQERIVAWMSKHAKRPPANILYYRDGVDDAQFAKVRSVELKAIRAAWNGAIKAFSLLPPKVPLRLSAVVVTKRHNTRFFPLNPKEETTSNNCRPGTCVDVGIVSPYYFDFFLLSHNALAGTARPAHYYVIENGMHFKADELQRFTFDLCSTYGKIRTTGSYAPPAYYADKLCERGRLYLEPLADMVRKDPPPSAEEVMEDAKKIFYRGGDRETPGGGTVGVTSSSKSSADNTSDAGPSSVDTQAKPVIDANPWHKNHDGKMFWM